MLSPAITGSHTKWLCEERSDEAISRHYVTDGQIAAPFGLEMTI